MAGGGGSSTQPEVGEERKGERGREGGANGRRCRQHKGFFAYVHQQGVTCHTTPALRACMARLGPWIDHLTQFRDLNGQFESLET
jgi:hypothetical protein